MGSFEVGFTSFSGGLRRQTRSAFPPALRRAGAVSGGCNPHTSGHCLTTSTWINYGASAATPAAAALMTTTRQADGRRQAHTSVSSASRFSSSERELFSTTLTAYLACSFRCVALLTTENRPLWPSTREVGTTKRRGLQGGAEHG